MTASTLSLDAESACPLHAVQRALTEDVEHPPSTTPGQLCAATDLCVLALMAASGELEAENDPRSLAPPALRRLQDLEGARPAHWWSDLLARAEALNLLHQNARRWEVTNEEAELLGATPAECFPALLASWLADPRWSSALPEEVLPPSPKRDRFRMELVRALGVFTPENTYRWSTLQLLVRALLEEQDAALTGPPLESLTRALLERVFAVLGAVTLDDQARTFRVRPGITLPPLPPRLERLRPPEPSRAERFRLMIEARLRSDDTWTRVAPQLREVDAYRRTRQCCTSAFRGLSSPQPRIVTPPQTPFKDCLFLARFGRLVHDEACPVTPGQFIFEIDPQRLESAPPSADRSGDALLAFVARRSTDERLLGRLQQAITPRSRAHDRDS